MAKIFSSLSLKELKFFLPWKEIDFNNETSKISKVVVVARFASSKNQALQLIQAKGIKLNGQLVNDPNMTITRKVLFKGQNLILSKGKSNLFLVIFKFSK